MPEETKKKEDKREDLSKRGMKDGVYRSGSFKKAKKKGYKVANLTKKQVKRGKAGGKKVTEKQAKAAQKNVVQISDTKFVRGEGVMGPDGKPLTGKVQLASGKMAHYVNGRRVKSGGPKGNRSGGGRGGSGSGGSRTGRSSSSANRGGANADAYKTQYGKKSSGPPNQTKSSSRQERKNEPPGRTKSVPGRSGKKSSKGLDIDGTAREILRILDINPATTADNINKKLKKFRMR